MANKVKTIVQCVDCKNTFRVSMGSNASICPDCLTRNKNIKKIAENLKEEIAYSKRIEFDLSSQPQKLHAVKAQGEVFASHDGGVDLMITEFVENSLDAIKKRKIMEAFPKALKQMNFSPELEKIVIEKYTLPYIDFNKKHKKITEDESESFSKLQNKILEIIEKENQRKENIIIELDDKKREVRIIDSGTGIEHPLHICEKPFVSLKTGEDYSTGKFGRGSQVFRAFCDLMQFYSVRNKISVAEEDNIIKENIDTSKFDPKSVRIDFPADFAGGDYNFINSKQFKEYSNYNRIGTVVILSGWKETYYDDLSRHITKLHRRLVHHFGFAIDDIYNIGLKLKHKTKVIEIIPKDYANEEKIDGLFKLEPIELKDDFKNTIGKVEFYIYKTTRSFSDDFKEPFLVVNGRPLGDTSISKMPGLSQYKEIWQSHTITGYIVCNAVEPNQLRIGLAENFARVPFFHAMTNASISLKGLNTIWKKELSSAKDVEMTNEVIQTVTKFLSKKGIKFNFKNPLQKGIQDIMNKSGDEMSDERTSTDTGDTNPSRIVDDGDETVDVGYKPTKIGPTVLPTDTLDVIVVPHGGHKKDGDKIIKVKVKRSLVSKGGKIIRKTYSGPDLDFNTDEDCGDELSYFEPEPPTVMIQSEHDAWKRLTKKARTQRNGEKFEKEKKNYLLERYLWELMNNKAIQKDDEMDDEARRNMFWTYYHDLTDTR